MRTDGIEFPKGLLLAKPIGQESYKESVIFELERKGRLIIQRKHDGYKLIAIKGADGRFRIWTVGGRPMHGRLPDVIDYLQERTIREGTVLVGEGLMYENNEERYEFAAKVFQGGDENGLRVQRIHGPAQINLFQAFNITELEREERRTARSYQDTLAWFTGHFLSSGPAVVSVADSISSGYDSAKERVSRLGWEGLVLTDAFYQLAWRLDGAKGKEPRPTGCYKYKLPTEDDFFVTGEGRIWHPDGRLKEVILQQYDPASGTAFSCGKLGTFTAEVRNRLAAKRLKTTVLQVAFERRNPDTGKLRFARFERFRAEKAPEACIAPASYPKTELA